MESINNKKENEQIVSTNRDELKKKLQSKLKDKNKNRSKKNKKIKEIDEKTNSLKDLISNINPNEVESMMEKLTNDPDFLNLIEKMKI